MENMVRQVERNVYGMSLDASFLSVFGFVLEIEHYCKAKCKERLGQFSFFDTPSLRVLSFAAQRRAPQLCKIYPRFPKGGVKAAICRITSWTSVSLGESVLKSCGRPPIQTKH